MPRTNRATEELKDYGPVAETSADLGGYTASFTTFKIDLDGAPMLKGLVNDRCQCPHWGYVLRGSISFGYDDHVDEHRDLVHGAGDDDSGQVSASRPSKTAPPKGAFFISGDG